MCPENKGLPFQVLVKMGFKRNPSCCRIKLGKILGMAEHNDIGNQSEQMASEWLQAKGYELLRSNYRYKHAEIDLIMKHQGLLVFVEVKFRSGTGFGYAEEFVDYKKRQLIIRAADNFIYEIDWHKDIRFDIVGVYRSRDGQIAFKHFQDAFY